MAPACRKTELLQARAVGHSELKPPETPFPPPPQVFLQRSAVNLLSRDLLDTPEYFWSAPDALQVGLGPTKGLHEAVLHPQSHYTPKHLNPEPQNPTPSKDMH